MRDRPSPVRRRTVGGGSPDGRLIIMTMLAALLSGCSGGSRAYDDPAAGKIVITNQACGSCHMIPGIDLAQGLVGPPLAHLAARQIIAGKLPNNRTTLAQFLKSPQSVVPGGAMPDMGLTPREAQDAAAYLLTLE
jgi:cytochrome c2